MVHCRHFEGIAPLEHRYDIYLHEEESEEVCGSHVQVHDQFVREESMPAEYSCPKCKYRYKAPIPVVGASHLCPAVGKREVQLVREMPVPSEAPVGLVAGRK